MLSTSKGCSALLGGAQHRGRCSAPNGPGCSAGRCSAPRGGCQGAFRGKKKKAKCSNKLSFFPHCAVGSPWLLRTCKKKEAVPRGWYLARQGGVGKNPPKSHSCFFSSCSAALPPYPTTFRVLALLALLVAVPSCSSLDPWLYLLRPSPAAPQTPHRPEPTLQDALWGLQPHFWDRHHGQLSLRAHGGCMGPLGVSGPTPQASFAVGSSPRSELRLRAPVGWFWTSPRISKEFPKLSKVLLAKRHTTKGQRGGYQTPQHAVGTSP